MSSKLIVNTIENTTGTHTINLDSGNSSIVGNLTVGGNLDLSSGGVYLGGSGSANLLDDYEEGTWTPVIYGSSSAGTMGGPSTQGKYTKVGNQVTCWCYINSATLSGASGDLGVSGLPFTATITNPAVSISSAMRNNLSLPTNGTTAFFVLVNGGNSGTFRVSYTNNTNSTLLPTTSIGSSCSAAFSITYTTAS